MQVAQPIPYDELLAERGASVPALLHTIGGDADALAAAHPGWIVRKWTLPEIDAVVRCAMPPRLRSIAAAADAAKALIYPHALLYLFGGVFLDVAAKRSAAPILQHFHSTILFFVVESPTELQRMQAVFGVSPVMMASAPCIAATTSLLEIVAQKVEQGSYGEEMHHAVVNQFVRAALNGSSNEAVKLLDYGFVDCLLGVDPPGGALAAELLAYLRRDVLREPTPTHVMRGALHADDLEALENVRRSDGVRGAGLLFLYAGADAERPVDANMDVALALHEAGALAPGAHVVLHTASAAIAEVSLKMQGCELVGEWGEARVWKAGAGT